MMSDIKIPAFIDLAAAIRNVTTAQQAVHEGIASHVEKEQAARQQRHDELQAQNKVKVEKK